MRVRLNAWDGFLYDRSGAEGRRSIYREAAEFRRVTAGDHKGPPSFSTPPSPLHFSMGFSYPDTCWMTNED